MNESATRLIDNLEVCRRLGVRPDTWRKRVDRGDSPLPFSRQGARTYYRERDIAYYLKKGVWPASMRFKARARAEPSEVEAGHS